LIDNVTHTVRALVGLVRPAPVRGGGRLGVLLVGLNSGFGGVEQHLVDLSAELVVRGHRVALAAPCASLLAEKIRRGGGVDVYEIPRSPAAVPALRQLILRLRPDVVHLHSPRASVIGRLTARLLPESVRVRTVVLSTAHGWISIRLKLRRLHEALYMWTARWEDGIVAVARAVQTTLVRRGYPGRIWLVPNGINPTRDSEPESSRISASRPFSFGYFGRLEREKGLDGLVDALARLKSSGWRLDIYGTGRDRRRIERRVAAAGLQERVIFLGALAPEAVRSRMVEYQALVLPSLQEGWPYVILDAMSLGVPVVASAVGGVSEMIRDGEDGLLVPPANPEALANALRRMYDDPALLARLSRNARSRIQGLTSVRMTDELMTVYGQALGGLTGVRRNVRGINMDTASGDAAPGGDPACRVSRSRPHPAP
jgi:glycosyltransferase involved in cell wall biosynthesis